MKQLLLISLLTILCNLSFAQNKLIKTDDNSVFYEVEGKELYHFAGSTFNKKGVKNNKKKLIIPTKYYYISYHKGIFKCDYGFLESEGIDFYDKTGRLIVPASSYVSWVTSVTLSNKEYYEIKKNDYTGIIESQNLKTIIPPNYKTIFKNKDNYFEVEDSRGLHGIYTIDGIKIVPCQYNAIKKENDYFIVKRGIFEGVVTSGGKEIIPPLSFLKVEENNGVFIVQTKGVKQGGYKGVIDNNGKCIIYPDKYTDVETMQNGMYKVTSGRKTGICDSKGKELFMTNYTDIGLSPGKTYYICYIGVNKGTMDLNGNVLKEPETKPSKTKFDGTKYYLLHNEKGCVGLADEKGHVVLPAKYDNYRFDSYYCYPLLNGKESLYTLDGKMIIPDGKFHSIEFDRTNEYLKVMLDNKMGLYTMDGKPIFEPYKYDKIEEFADMRNTYKVYQGDLMGLVNRKGEIILPMKYTNVYRPNKGGRNQLEKSDFDYLEVVLFDKYGICTLDGKEIIPPIYTDVTSYLEYGFFKVEDGDKVGVYTKEGKEIIPARQFSSIHFRKEKGSTPYISAESDDRECTYDFQGKIISDNKKIPKEFYDNFEMGNYYYNKKDYNSAIEYFTKSLKYKQDCESFFNIGLCYYIGDKYSKSIENFELCLANNPYQSLRERALDLIESSKKLQTSRNAKRKNTLLTFLGVLAGTASAVIQANYNRNTNANYREGNYDYLLDPRYTVMQVQQQNYNEYLQMTNGGQTMSYEEWYANVKAPALAEEYGNRNDNTSNSTSSKTSSLSSSRTSSSSPKSCRFCAGLGSCKTCGGRGFYFNSHNLSQAVTCPNCKNHDGLCTHCGGTGYN